MVSYEQAFNMQGRVALITGGSSGLGFAMAKCLASAGASVVLVSRREDALRRACEEIGDKAFAIPFDVTRVDEMDSLVDRVLERHKRIDVLINCAGIHIKKPAEDLTIQEFTSVLEIHLNASFALTQRVIPCMKRQQRGSVIFVSSMSGFIGLTKVAAYSAAKTGVLGLTRSLASELSGEGIRFNAIVPGFIETPMFRKAVGDDPERQRKILDRTPMKKFGDPLDIGWAALYLASDASAFVTGTSLVVDGGALIGF
ncbi:MAG: SDR family oxidoreductase [Synergistaceae bacterium]|jgi:gluconate 5-dehydrogenase|nr:SDR family oxidoreductase [Synergistaceae bacterium]